jgi:hypothetical protein
MSRRTLIGTAVIGALVLSPLAGCESLPGDKKTQGAVIGGVGGAAAGALVAKDNRLIGGLIGGALGAGGGYLIGAQLDKTDAKNHDEAVRAARDAEARPAQASDVKNSDTADLNRDGYVTMDEVVAMKDARLSDSEMIRRLDKTNQVFELTEQQESYLRDRGVDSRVITAMLDMNRDTARTVSDGGNDRISYERN